MTANWAIDRLEELVYSVSKGHTGYWYIKKTMDKGARCYTIRVTLLKYPPYFPEDEWIDISYDRGVLETDTGHELGNALCGEYLYSLPIRELLVKIKTP